MYESIQPAELTATAWQALCVRCDGQLVAAEAADFQNKLCGICVTGPTTEPMIHQIPTAQDTPNYWENLRRNADEVVVEAILSGLKFDGQLYGERIVAATELLRLRPDLSRREISEWVGVHHRTITRLVANLYRVGQRIPLREDVVEKLMAGRRNRINPTRHEASEAVRRLIRQGADDLSITKLTGVTLAAVRGHRHRESQGVGVAARS